MTPPAKPQNPDASIPSMEHFSHTHATVMLKLGMTSAKKPADQVAERMAAPDGAAWLIAALEWGPMRGIGKAESMLLRGQAALEQLELIKKQSKALVNAQGDPDRWMSGIAGYFFAIAAGLVHYCRHIGSQPLADVNDSLLELASAAREPWAEFLTRAAAKASELEARNRVGG